MNQRIAVRAIVQKDEKTLLLKRARGRESILGKYELPGGELEYGEQPEDALTRHFKEKAGIVIKKAKLFDVLTYIDHDKRDIQYIIILYLVSAEARIQLGPDAHYSHHVWRRVGAIPQEDLTESTKLLLGISQQVVPEVKKDQLIGRDVAKTVPLDYLIVYSDGGSRGNPGPSAAGFVVMDKEERVIHEGGAYLGITTNNQAEYKGVLLGLEKAHGMHAKIVEFRLDSLLVVNQMNGVYKIRNRELWPIYERIRELVKEFEKVTFSHVRREFNQLADGMVNKILDAQADDGKIEETVH